MSKERTEVMKEKVRENAAMVKRKVRKPAEEWLLITLGIVLMTVGIYFFKFPNHFPPAGSRVFPSCWAGISRTSRRVPS